MPKPNYNQRLRIAVYHNLHSGGAKRVTAEHVQRLARCHAVTLFAPSTADKRFATENQTVGEVPTVRLEFQPLRELRSPLGRLNQVIRLFNARRMDQLAQKFAARIDQGGFDVVLVHPCQMTQAPQLLRHLRTPSLYYVHELPRRLYEELPARPYYAASGLQAQLDRWDPLIRLNADTLRRLDVHCARRATQLVSNSRYIEHQAETVYTRPVAVCPPAVSESFLLDRRPGETRQRRQVLSVGALAPHKGFDFIIQALATLPAAERPPLLIISNYQEPQERNYLQTLAAALDVSLEMRTGVSERDLRAGYAAAACVAYAPWREPFGLVALEAMAAGAALAGVAEGGLLETVINGVTGVLTPREPIAFGRAILELLTEPERAQALSQAARQHVVNHFTWDQHMGRLETLLQQTASRQAQ
jgi:glycosyltransferase involved in cell wall biosynthesis